MFGHWHLLVRGQRDMLVRLHGGVDNSSHDDERDLKTVEAEC